MAEYTLEPWHLVTDAVNGRLTIEDRADRLIADVVKREDALRTVACVNGCKGLDPSAYRECVDALKALINAAPRSTNKMHNDQYEALICAIDAGIAALAKARGER